MSDAADPTFSLSTHPVHLGLGARVVRLEPMDGTLEWYERYGTATESDGTEGRLVSMHTFSEPWDSWEMHPLGEELVVCTAGTITLHQEHDGDPAATVATVTLGPGEAVINPPGVWHTADVDGECTALFITAGTGTDMRPR
jgi:mannose-6-phosphate isomerase-like protein (cupin superfamily)